MKTDITKHREQDKPLIWWLMYLLWYNCGLSNLDEQEAIEAQKEIPSLMLEAAGIRDFTIIDTPIFCKEQASIIYKVEKMSNTEFTLDFGFTKEDSPYAGQLFISVCALSDYKEAVLLDYGFSKSETMFPDKYAVIETAIREYSKE